MSSPTQRTIKALKELGFTCQIVEYWSPFAKRRIDLFNCIDIVAVKEGVGIIGVQTTSADNHSARMNKARETPAIAEWLRAGARFEVWSWGVKGARGKRKLWTLRREELKGAG